jgi:hypothetical protein
MHRDMDLLRKALLAIEDLPSTANQPLNLEGHEFQMVQYHVDLLHQHAFIEALKINSMAGTAFIPSGLTAEGHELADSIRDDDVWERIKELSLKQTGSLTLEGLRRATTVFIRSGGNLMATANQNTNIRRRILEELPEQAKRSSVKPFVDYRHLPASMELPSEIILDQLGILELEHRVKLNRMDQECAVMLTPLGLKSLEVTEEEWQRANSSSATTAAQLHISDSHIGTVAQVAGSQGVSINQIQQSTPIKDVFTLIDRIVATVSASNQVTTEVKSDCEIEADQLKGELRKSKPNAGRVKEAFEWFKRLDGAATLGVHLAELGRKLNDWFPGAF